MAGFGSSFTGSLIGGFQGDAQRQREENQREAERQTEREKAVFSALANSEDPDVRAAAVTGLLTGNHPAGFLDKFFGKMREHPSYETIKGLVANEHQPFLSQSEQAGRNTAANVQGGITGAVKGAQAARNPDGTPAVGPDDTRRIVMARSGAALPGNKPLQHGTFFNADGSVAGSGSYDPNSGNYYDADGSYKDATNLRFSAAGTQAGAGSTSQGGTWAQMTGADFKRQYPNADPGAVKDDDYVRVRVGSNGVPVGAPVISQGPSSALDKFSFFPTTTGIGSGVSSGPHAGTVNPTAAGGANVQRPEPPATTAGQYRADIQQILAIHPPPKSTSPFFPVTAAQQQKWLADVDAEAKKRGYAGWDALQGLAGGASRDTAATTPPPPTVAAPAGPKGPPGTSAPNAPKKGDRVGDGPAPTVNPLDPFGILR